MPGCAASDAWARELGEEHEKTLKAANSLAIVFDMTGRMDEAEALYRRVLAARRTELGDWDHSTSALLDSHLPKHRQGARPRSSPPLRQRQLSWQWEWRWRYNFRCRNKQR